MDKTTEIVKTLISRQVDYNKIFYEGIPFSKYQKFYFCTNEYIKGYLQDIKNKERALSVLSSGDHLFNLIEKGIKNVDTFDTNLLTKYYVYGIRYAMFLKYSYNEYIKSLKKIIDKNTTLEELTNILLELLPFMDIKYRKFWKVIIEYNYSYQKNKTNLNLFNLISLGIEDINEITLNNGYLSNEKNYNNLKKNILIANTSFKNINAIKLPKKYNEIYDLILLSNIPEYLGNYFYNYDFIEYINSLKNMINTDGIIFFNYIHKYKTKNIIRKHIFTYLNEEGHNIINKEIKSTGSKEDYKDGIIILRKK